MRKNILSILLICFLILGLTGCGNKEKVNKTLSYLQDNGYSCKEGTYHVGVFGYKDSEDTYMCEKKENNYTKQFVICKKDKFELELTVIDDEGIYFRLKEYNFHEVYPTNTISLKKGEYSNPDNIGYQLYGKNGNNLRNGVELGDECSQQSISDYSAASSDESLKKCDITRDFLKIVNDSIKEYMDTYKAIDVELPKKSEYD